MPLQASPTLCYVTDRRGLAPAAPDHLRAPIQEAIFGGVDWIQIREKDMPVRALLELSQWAARVAGNTTKILVNDRLDVALASGAAGVHLGGESAPVAEVAHWRRAGHAPAGFLLGASCHQLPEALAAERDGADYLFFGPIFATPSKLAYAPPQGVERLAEICRSVRIPVLAIGGITATNAAECLRAGALGIAAIRLFQQAASLPALVALLRATR